MGKTANFGTKDLDGNKKRLMKKLMSTKVITSSGDSSIRDESLILRDD
jgi:hypothetical protein